jgi:integrase/recombinase XerD
MQWHDLLTEFLDAHTHQWTSTTRAWYRRQLDPFMVLAGELALAGPASLTLAHIRRFLGQQQPLVASSTLNGVHTAMGMFFRWLKSEGQIPTDIFAEARLKRPRRPKRIPRDLPLSYIERMIAAAEAEASSLALRDLAIMRLLISTGMRRIEVARLKLIDFDLVEKIAIVRGKRDDERLVFPDDEAVRAAQRWLVVRPETLDPAMFVALAPAINTPVGSALRADHLNDRLCVWRDRAGIPATISVSPHKWRHTFATHYVINGGEAFSLAQLLGHSDVQTTQIYVSGVRSVLREKAAQYRPVIK